MSILVNPQEFRGLENKYIFVDNDFLGEIFRDSQLFQLIIKTFPEGNILIDPLVEFEFLRDIYDPRQRGLRENFVNSTLFGQIPVHQEIFLKLQENALILSKIFAHQDKQNQKHRSSLVDLFLAARVMYWFGPSLLITGNKKDFPSSIFDLIGVINSDQTGDGSVKVFSILQFNKGNFNICLQSCPQ